MDSTRITDQLFAVLKNVAIQRPLTSDMDLPDLESLSLADANDRSEAEKESFKIQSELLKIASFLAGSKVTNADQADKALAVVEEWLNEKIKHLTLEEAKYASENKSKADYKISPIISATTVHIQPDNPSGPTWVYLHTLFTLLETLKALSQLITLGGKKTPNLAKISKERLGKMATLVPEVFELVRSNTRALKNHISAPGVLSALVDNTLQGSYDCSYGQELQMTLEETVGNADLELFCGSLMESWEEALNGVLGVKL